MKSRRSILLSLAGTLIVACSCPAIALTGATPAAPTATEAASATTAASAESPAVTQTLTATVGPPTACTPQLTANSNANVRSGPGTVYNEVGGMTAGQMATIDGQNAEGTWWRIVFPSGPGGHGWVAASVSTAICVTGVAAVVPPATPTEEVVIQVIDASISVDPKEIHVAGCMGPIQPSTAYATITVNGPLKVKWHFNTDQLGALPSHTLSFADAGSKDVSEDFTPLVSAGTYWVRLVIEGQDLGQIQAKYKVVC